MRVYVRCASSLQTETSRHTVRAYCSSGTQAEKCSSNRISTYVQTSKGIAATHIIASCTMRHSCHARRACPQPPQARPERILDLSKARLYCEVCTQWVPIPRSEERRVGKECK